MRRTGLVEALKQAGAQPTILAPTQQPGTPPGPEPPKTATPTGRPAATEAEKTTPKLTPVVWQGQLKREQWNLFSLKVLTRLAQAEDVQIEVKVCAKLKEGQSVEQLNSALGELGIDEPFHKE